MVEKEGGGRRTNEELEVVDKSQGGEGTIGRVKKLCRSKKSSANFN